MTVRQTIRYLVGVVFIGSTLIIAMLPATPTQAADVTAPVPSYSGKFYGEDFDSVAKAYDKAFKEQARFEQERNVDCLTLGVRIGYNAFNDGKPEHHYAIVSGKCSDQKSELAAYKERYPQTCVDLSTTFRVYMDRSDLPNDLGDTHMGDVTLNHYHVCVERNTGLIVTASHPQFQNIRTGLGVSFDGWQSPPLINPGEGTRQLRYSILAKYEFTIAELIDYFGLGDINDVYIRYKSHTFVDRQDREICVEMYDTELTFDGVLPPTTRTYITEPALQCLPY